MTPEPHCLERLWAVAGRPSGRPSSSLSRAARRLPRGVAVLVRLRRVPRDRPGGRAPEASCSGGPRTPSTCSGGSPRPGIEAGGRRRHRAHNAIRQGDGRAVVEVLLRGPEHALRAPPCQAPVGRYPRNVSKLLARAVLREQEGRIRRLGVMAWGLWDGARGSLGMRFPVEPMQERRHRGRTAGPPGGPLSDSSPAGRRGGGGPPRPGRPRRCPLRGRAPAGSDDRLRHGRRARVVRLQCSRPARPRPGLMGPRRDQEPASRRQDLGVPPYAWRPLGSRRLRAR